MGQPAWARVFLEVTMRLGLSVNQDYWYVIALSSSSGSNSSGPTANLTDPNITVGTNDQEFVQDWDYLIRVKPLNEEAVLQATIQEPGGPEVDFITGFNDVRVENGERDQDTITLSIDLDELSNLNAVEEDVQVSLITIKAPFRVDPEETNLAIDAVRGNVPNYYRLSLTNQRQVLVEDAQRQETLRRSRELITRDDIGNVTAADSIEGSALGILAANILTFNLELVER
ncbi:MAG: hypothetical protein HC921_02830 [Synechococcaceae cyanobacterium SM2_3_1]|nr:hypothetical protein [Synechococcaceae cyanobacterium SM2_3_1]